MTCYSRSHVKFHTVLRALIMYPKISLKWKATSYEYEKITKTSQEWWSRTPKFGLLLVRIESEASGILGTVFRESHPMVQSVSANVCPQTQCMKCLKCMKVHAILFHLQRV